MNNPFYCVMIPRGRLTVSLCNKLFQAARTAVLEKREEINLDDPYCWGVVRTEMKNATLGGVTGILFSAKIESETGVVEVTYIIRRKDLEKTEDLVWVLSSARSSSSSNSHLN